MLRYVWRFFSIVFRDKATLFWKGRELTIYMNGEMPLAFRLREQILSHMILYKYIPSVVRKTYTGCLRVLEDCVGARHTNLVLTYPFWHLGRFKQWTVPKSASSFLLLLLLLHWEDSLQNKTQEWIIFIQFRGSVGPRHGTALVRFSSKGSSDSRSL